MDEVKVAIAVICFVVCAAWTVALFVIARNESRKIKAKIKEFNETNQELEALKYNIRSVVQDEMDYADQFWTPRDK